jgi:hypothetical protein
MLPQALPSFSALLNRQRNPNYYKRRPFLPSSLPLSLAGAFAALGARHLALPRRCLLRSSTTCSASSSPSSQANGASLRGVGERRPLLPSLTLMLLSCPAAAQVNSKNRREPVAALLADLNRRKETDEIT